jgi:dimethylargininase
MLAITHVPSPNLDQGQRTHVARLPIDYELACKQHEQYCGILRACGVLVRLLDANRGLPDAVFVEDLAVVLDEVAVLASMKAERRCRELAAIVPELACYRPLKRVERPATLEGGGVLRLGRHLLVGLSSRTNHAGMLSLEEIARPYGFHLVPVPVRGCLHLKTACTALPDGTLLINPAWVDSAALNNFPTLSIPGEEPWAANSLSVGATVLLAAEHVRTAELLQRRGLDVRPVCLSEFAKAEGGVTCLCLLIDSCPQPAALHSAVRRI